MAQPYSSPLSVRECFAALRRHWKGMVAIYAVCILAAVGFLTVWPKSYESSAKLYVRMGRENIMLDPTVTASQMVMVQRSQENEINSLLEVLESRWMAEQVVDAVGVETVLSGGSSLEGDSDAEGSDMMRWKQRVSEWVNQAVAVVAYPMDDRDRAIKRVQDRTTFFAPKDSTVITIAHRAGSPEQAHRIVSAVTDAFAKAHLRLNRTRGTLKFFEEQSEMLHYQLMRIKQKLSDQKNEFGMLSLEGRRTAVEQQISAIELQSGTTDRDLSAAQSKTRVLQEQLAQVPPQVSATVQGVGHEGWNRMREKLYGVEISEIEANAKYMPTHPFVVARAKEREDASRILNGQAQEQTQVTSNPNPTYLALELDLKRQLAEGAALQSSHDLLARQLADLKQKLNAINTQEVHITDLQRQADLLEASYRTHAEKLEQARIDDALANEKISSLNTVQSATFEPHPASPKRALTLFSALVVATFGSLVLTFVSEHANPPLRSRRQVESVLDLPVLASIARARPFPATSNGGANLR